MPRVLGIDPGTVSIDLCGLDGTTVWLDRTLPTRDALQDPAAFLQLLTAEGPPDLIAGPSGYGLPLIRARDASETDLRLAYLAHEGETGGIGGLRGLAKLLAGSGLPVLYTPGVIHLPTVPSHRKLNRVDLGTADKVAAAALGIWAERRRLGSEQPSFILLELGGAFSAAIAVERGAIVDGVGGTSGPMGWRSGGAWDGEVAFLAGEVTKEMLFWGGVEGGSATRRLGDSATLLPADTSAIAAYVEQAYKAVLSLTASVAAPESILLSGRHSTDPDVRAALEPLLARVAPVRELQGFAAVAKQGAQGAALLADGLAGGSSASLVETLRLREASGTALDYLRVISPEVARRRLGIG